MLNLLDFLRVLWIKLCLSSEVKLPEFVGIADVLEDEVKGKVDPDIVQFLLKCKVLAGIPFTELVQVVEELGGVNDEGVPHQQECKGGPVDMARNVQTNAGKQVTSQINA